MKKTGENIKSRMRDKGLKPQDVCDMLDISSVSAIYKWFNGDQLPSIYHLIELSELFDCEIDDLLKIDNV